MPARDAADSITATVRFLKTHQSARLTQQVISTRLYGNMAMLGYFGVSYSKVASVQSGLRDRISYNVVQSAIDTVTAKIGKNKPKPLFLTSGGDSTIQRKAKKLNQFLDGIFYENNAHALGVQAFRDGCVFGDGVVHVYADTRGRVRFERVIPSEIYVDEIEAVYGEPRQLHRVKDVDRLVLADMFPSHRKAIMEAHAVTENGRAQQSNISDMVTVRESWHLPSGPDAKDGKHVITIAGAALTVMEDWAHDFFPFARFRWAPRMTGYWSQSLAEQIQNIQIEINKLLQIIQRSFHLGGSFKVFVENTSKIVSEHLNNDIGAIVRYTGQKPEYVVPPLVPPEIFQHLQTLKGAAYEQAGISQLSASSTKPAGLNSGKALREYNDIESDRFQTIGQEYERFFLELGRLAIATVKDLLDDGTRNYEVKTVSGGKFLSTVDWKSIDLDESKYVMQCFPVSSLPNTPEGRLETVQELAAARYITDRQAKKLLNFPDLEHEHNLQTAQEEYLTFILEKMVDDSEYTPPEPYDDLQLARELALEYYAQGKRNNLEEERLELLRRFMAQVEILQTAATAATAPAPGASQAPPSAPEAMPNPGPANPTVQ